MYIETIGYQTQIFLLSCGFGFLLGIIYELIKFFRELFKIRKKKIFICDIIFSLIASFMSVIFALSVSHGRFSFSLVSGMTAGFVVYFLTLGVIVNRQIVKFAHFVRKLCIKIKK